MVFRTSEIDAYVSKNLAGRAQKAVGNISADILVRIAAFLLMKDSKSSYAIEGEFSPNKIVPNAGVKRLERKGKNSLICQNF